MYEPATNIDCETAALGNVREMDIDEALGAVGGLRRGSLFIFILISTSVLMVIVSGTLTIIFTGFTPPHHCRLPSNTTAAAWIPREDASTSAARQRCAKYVSLSSNETESCGAGGWQYGEAGGIVTLVTEWDLVCQHDYHIELIIALYQVGAMVGDISSTIIIDKYGRKWVHAGGYIVSLVIGCSIAAAPNIIVFSCLSTVMGFAVFGTVMAGYTQMVELTDSKSRYICKGYSAFWSVCYFYLGLLAWTIKDWRYLQLAMSLSIALGFLTFFIPESPLWLAANNRHKEAEEVLGKLARINGVKLTAPIRIKKETLRNSDRDNGEENCPNETATEGESVWDLFTDPLLRRYTLVGTALWFNVQLVYYFMVLGVPSLTKDVLHNFLIGGSLEVPAIAVSWFGMRWSRRYSTCLFYVLTAVAMAVISCASFMTDNESHAATLKIVMSCVGKFAVTAAFVNIILYTREIFPTNLRGRSSAACTALGRVGSLCCPFAIYYVKKKPWIPNGVLAALSVCVAIAVLVLPETGDWPLPQSIGDVYRFSRGDHRKDKGTNSKNDILLAEQTGWNIS